MESDLQCPDLHFYIQMCGLFNGAKVTLSCALMSVLKESPQPSNRCKLPFLAKRRAYKTYLSIFLFKVFKFLPISQAQWRMNVNPRDTHKIHQISPIPSSSSTHTPTTPRRFLNLGAFQDPLYKFHKIYEEFSIEVLLCLQQRYSNLNLFQYLRDLHIYNNLKGIILSCFGIHLY